jgi:hypothetical protein
MTSITIRQLIKAKFENLFKFLENVLDKDFDKIKAYKDIETELIVEMIKLKVIPLKHSQDYLIERFFDDLHIDITKLSNEDKDKLKKYLNFFVDVVERL